MKNPDFRIDMTRQALLGEFLSDLARRRCSPNTIRAYRASVQKLLRFMAIRGVERLQDLTPEDMEAYRQALCRDTPAAASQYHYLSKVRRFLAWLERRQCIFLNPAVELRMPKCGYRLGFVPTEAEVRWVLAQPDLSTPVGIRDRALLETAYSTGCRLAELVAMDVADCDLEQGAVVVRGKGNRERVVPLGRVAAHWVGRYLADARPGLLLRSTVAGRPGAEPALWIGRRGRRLGPRMVDLALRCYGRAAGISSPLSPHALRRACASHMLANGAGPVEIQTMLGHASLLSLSQYLRVSIADLKQAHARANPGA